MEKARNAVAADPAHANAINAWLVSTSQSITATPPSLLLSSGRLDAWFTGADGQQVAVLADLANPPSLA